ncbi:hypothetical protein [Amycolatopsis sp. NPDC049868]|uniref:hypothetical protein n=1 Tax=Amycolatopsis sp. NPDC049868 TaxID=3363934 RepID=UPI0037AB341F
MAENHVADDLNQREYAILRAVAEGRGTLVAGCEPDLAVDGGWCDHMAVHCLVTRGLICGERPVPVGSPTPAMVTSAGRAALNQVAHGMAA